MSPTPADLLAILASLGFEDRRESELFVEFALENDMLSRPEADDFLAALDARGKVAA